MTGTENNLESFFLVWLDADVKNTKTNGNALRELRKCIYCFKTFEDGNECENYIRSVPNDDRIILIVSVRLAKEIVPPIHDLRQVFSIYVYGTDKKANEEWTKDYPKVKGVITKLDVLIENIRSDYGTRGPNKADESLVFNIFNPSASSEQSSTVLNGQFVYSQLLINCLLRMKAISTDKDKLIALSKKEYKDNKNELAIVHEFAADYSSDRSLWWYTRESFLYRQLNKALRVQNIDSIFVFRFFIRDIEKQLEQHRFSSPIRLFRGQLMSTEEVQVLKDSIGQLISMNAFLSASVDRRLALSFLYSSTLSSNTQRVLLEINANPQLDDVKPFANITSLSYFPGEDEVLLMLGSIFRIASIDHGSTGIWIIRLTLCSNNDHDLQVVFDHMKDQYGDGETNLISFGLELRRMGKFDEAEKYYHHVLNELPPDHVDIASCYRNLGNVFNDKGDYELSLNWHQKALDAMLRVSPLDESNIGTSLNSIVAIHTKMGNHDQALEVYKKVLAVWKHSMGEDHPNVALCLSKMGGIYQKYEKFSDALECLQQALTIVQKHLPAEHLQVGDLHNNIGSIHWCLDQSDLAFKHYTIALKIKQKSFPPQHPSIAMTLSNMGLIYEEKGDFQQALSHFEEAFSIYRHTVQPTHPAIIHMERLIQRASSKQKLN